jgi:hypothetical protein
MNCAFRRDVTLREKPVSTEYFNIFCNEFYKNTSCM